MTFHSLSGASTSGEDGFSVSKSLVVMLIVWQAFITLAFVVACVAVVIRRRGRRNRVNGPPPIDEDVVQRMGGVYEGTVVKRQGGKYETNISWTHKSTANGTPRSLENDTSTTIVEEFSA